MVSAPKIKAGKAIECDNVGGDATLHGTIREGPEQRAERSEGVNHVDNGGRAFYTECQEPRASGGNVLGMIQEQQRSLSSPLRHLAMHLTGGAVPEGPCNEMLCPLVLNQRSTKLYHHVPFWG